MVDGLRKRTANNATIRYYSLMGNDVKSEVFPSSFSRFPGSRLFALFAVCAECLLC